MSADDLEKIADLLGSVFIPDMVGVPTAGKCSEALMELARLQHALREQAAKARQDVA